MSADRKPAEFMLVPPEPTPEQAAPSAEPIVPVPEPGLRPDYHLGAIYALITAALLALQEPFSALAARVLKSWDFIGFTQVALLAAIPLLIARQEARRDFVTLLTTRAYWPKFLALLLIGLAGLAFYDLGLSGAHPIIAAAVLNLSPFWAALVGRVVAGSRLPGSPMLFFGCLAVAFIGATTIAWSQVDDGSRMALDVLHGLLRGHWLFAVPMPIFFALSGALVFVWFRKFDEGAAIAANFAVSAAVLIPMALFFAWGRGQSGFSQVSVAAIFMLLIAVLASSAAGRVFYQAALTTTNNDNGFVTMFFLIIPALAAIVSWPLSRWIPDLHFTPNLLFFGGLALVTAPLALFAIATLRKAPSAKPPHPPLRLKYPLRRARPQ